MSESRTGGCSPSSPWGSSVSGVHDQSLPGQARGYDEEAGEVTFAVTQGTTSGMLFLDSTGAFDYTPDLHFVGVDGFGFEVSNGTDTASAFVTITITNEAPVADSGSFSVVHDQSYAGMVSATDADTDMLTYSIDAEPLHGELWLDPSGSFIYELDAGFVGGDSFSFEATDGIAADTAFVTMDVTNTAPVAYDQMESTPHDQPLSSMVSGWDPDGDFLTARETLPSRRFPAMLEQTGLISRSATASSRILEP